MNIFEKKFSLKIATFIALTIFLQLLWVSGIPENKYAPDSYHYEKSYQGSISTLLDHPGDILAGTALALKIIPYLNHLLVFFIGFSWLHIFRGKIRNPLIPTFLLINSPGLHFYSGLILKETIALALITMVVLLTTRRITGLVKGLIVLLFVMLTVLLGTFTRPYFSTLLFCYFFFMKNAKLLNSRNLLRALVFDKKYIISIVALFSVYYLYVMNSGIDISFSRHYKSIILSNLSFIYSPNIFRVGNWLNFPFRTFESSIYIAVIFLGFIFKPSQTMRVVLMLSLVIIFYSTAAALAISSITLIDPNATHFVTEAPRTSLAIFPIIVFSVHSIFVSLVNKYSKFINSKKFQST
jgi:hypothetical protein